jgi:hypothetical protein
VVPFGCQPAPPFDVQVEQDDVAQVRWPVEGVATTISQILESGHEVRAEARHRIPIAPPIAAVQQADAAASILSVAVVVAIFHA